MPNEDIASHTALAATTAVYAVYLESLDSSYHPNKTFWTVVGGVALTGAGVALRFGLSVPEQSPRQVARWCWLQVVAHFVTSGSVIGVWQVWKHIELQKERRDGPARPWRERDY